ncbi:MAG: STT3 domain-containing protein [Candidatus Aenigmatarchaeota archaeon]
MNITKYWWVPVLVFIFIFSYYIRAYNVTPERILSFDPVFQYRYTYYVANYGHLPLWDELTYYTGRLVEVNTSPPLMLYMTAAIYWILNFFGAGMSLITLCAYMSAIYGALIVIPAFLLVRHISNSYGGLLSAILIGTAPQILTRTFGSSYDTDQVVLFFLISTLYLGLYAMKKKTIYSYCFAIIGFAGFLMTWGFSMYSFFILTGVVIIYFLLNLLLKGEGVEKMDFGSRLKASFAKSKPHIIFLILLLAGLAAFGSMIGESILYQLSSVVSFAQSAEQWIVNISIAELQPFNIFSLDGWITSTGRFVTNDGIIDVALFIIFIFFIAFGFFSNFKKKNVMVLSILATFLIVGVYSTFRGIRFTEFTSTLFITLIGAGFGALVGAANHDAVKKSAAIGTAIFIGLIAMNIGGDMAKQLGPDIAPNWESAWNFLKTQTPELSIVGTWWDPGHMINGLAQRRNFADGAHCHDQCLYNINDRIVDLGKIMATSDENVSMNLIRKYQGDSPKVYWIASDDLIGKFQWLQYFGTGCDARVDASCPLYIQIPQQSQSTDQSGNVIIKNYGGIQVFKGLGVPIPIYVEGINGALFDEILYYNQNNVTSLKLNDTEKQQLIQTLKPLESQLNFRFSNQSIPMTVWFPSDESYIVVIPKTLRESVFTKMFMLEGQGLEHFKEVFRNEQVKIFEVI